MRDRLALKLSFIDNVYTLNEIVQGRLREVKKTCILFRYTESL